MAKKKKRAGSSKKKAFPLTALLNGLFLGGWLLGLLAYFEIQAVAGAADRDGGILFAWAVTTFGFVYFAGALWVRGAWNSLPPYVTALSGLVPLFILAGAQASAGEIFTFAAMPWYVSANVCVAAMLLLWQRQEASASLLDGEGWGMRAWVWGLSLAFALGLAIYLLRNWTLMHLKVPADRNSLGLFYNPRNGGGATDISAGPFHELYRLIAPIQYLALIAAALYFYSRARFLEERWIYMGLVLLALAGKLAIAFLSNNGLEILGAKISSINTNYYNLTELIRAKGLWAYMSGYNALQQAQGAHGDTHPFGPVVFYWVLTLLLGRNPALIAAAVMLLASFTAPLIYRIASGHYRSREAGLAAALVYLSSPMSLILSGAGIDSIVLLFLALAMLAIQKGHEQPHWKWGAVAGALFFLGSLFSFGILLCLMFAGLWTVTVRLRASRSLEETALTVAILWGPLLGVLLLGHGLLLLVFGGSFSYLRSMRTAQFIHRSMNQYRTYEMWSWGNVVLYAGYAGVATLAAWFLRLLSNIWRGDNKDAFLLLSLPFVLTLVFACMGRAEVQREFLFGIFFLALPTAPFFMAKGPKKNAVALRTALLFGMVALNVANAVVLETTVLDFW